MRQADVFMLGEGDAWFERNRGRLGVRDPVMDAIELAGIAPRNVIEIGCADGWRLKKLQRQYGCDVAGVDASEKAVHAAGFARVVRGTADSLPFYDISFDVVILGFCLYLVDRADLFRVVAEVDRVLCDDGHLIIHDFWPLATPYAREYEHRAGLLSYHMDHPGLWLAHPWYRRIHVPTHSLVRGDEEVTVLRKEIAAAFPVM